MKEENHIICKHCPEAGICCVCSDCKGHPNTSKEDKQKIFRVGVDFATEDLSGYYPIPTTDTSNSWEEEFDERFSSEWWNGFGTNDDINKKGIKSIKSYISSLIEQVKKEEREKYKNECSCSLKDMSHMPYCKLSTSLIEK